VNLLLAALPLSSFVLFESDRNSFEVPKGWAVGKTSPLGRPGHLPWAGRRQTRASGNAIALSVKIPTKKDESQYKAWFQRMADMAKLR
jgi:hypothetical protein